MPLGSREVLADTFKNWSRPRSHSTDKTDTIIVKSQSRMHITESKILSHIQRDGTAKTAPGPKFHNISLTPSVLL